MGTLPIKITSGHLETYEALLLQFEEPSEPVERLDLSFGDVTQVFPTAFALMAAHVARYRDPAKRPLVSRKFGANPHSAKLERVMDSLGFIDAVAGKPGLRAPGSGVFPLTPIGPEIEPTVLAEELIDLVTESATGGNQPTRDAKEIVYVLVAEILENVVQHGLGDQPALLCAQLSAQKRKLEVCVVDSGPGVQGSFANGKDDAARKRIADGESALGLALEPGITSKGEGSNGLGLFVASEAAAMTRGIFRITSGSETVIVSREGLKYRTHAPWRGTIINMMLNITRSGSIAEVYGDLPLQRGKNERFFSA